MFSATTLSRFAVLAAVFLAQSHVDACGALPQCKTFREIYGGGKQLCENMWGDAFKYETNEDEGFGSYRNSAFGIYCSVSGNMCQHKPCFMWWDSGSNPNTQTVESLDSLLHLTSEHTDMCHLDYYHRETPGPAELTECAPYKDNACCEPSTVRSAQTIKEAYGQKYHWDRCGPLSPQCERYFVEEACFYECEPAAGHYRRYPATPSATVVDEHVRPEFESQCDSYSENYNATADCSHNSWELFQMPIKASYCDAWYEACADDFFCASEGGDFFSCAAEYEECDEGQGNHFAIGSPDDGDKTSSGDGEGGTSVGMAWTSAANLVVALTAVAFVAIV